MIPEVIKSIKINQHDNTENVVNIILQIYEEVQAAVGIDRLPEFNDLHKMPFTQAFLTEILRYRTVLPVVSREVARDVTINGRTIPQGSTVLINYWAAERDPALWEMPDDFVPERFLSSDGKTLIKQDSTHALGIGKKIRFVILMVEYSLRTIASHH